MDKESNNMGVGFLGLLTLIFIVLKLNPGGHLDSAVADWSWWWVLSPIWLPIVVILFIAISVGIWKSK